MASTYCLSIEVPAAARELFEAALESLGGAVVSGPLAVSDVERLELYISEPPAKAAVAACLAAAALAAGVAVPEHNLASLPETDWVAESQRGLPPIRAGRFFVYGSHVTEAPPPGSIALLVEANVAFGTGHHETTRGCLLAMSDLAKRQRVLNVLDMGCGSGLLAMAAARLWHCPVLAVDNDPEAVRVARDNAQLNHIRAPLMALCGDGYRAQAVGNNGPYDLILANILAEPLIAMAGDLSRHLARGGIAILSGLLTAQAPAVTARHRAAGLCLLRRYDLNGWVTLVLAG